jgi:NADH-quinone oxidoreductase subunit N
MNDQLTHLLGSLSGITPEVFLALGLLVTVTLELVWSRNGANAEPKLYPLMLAVLAGCGYCLGRQAEVQNAGFLFNHLLYFDGRAVFFKIIVTVAAAVAVLHRWVVRREREGGEWFSLVLGLLLGTYVLTMAVNLLAIYLGIELVSLSSYVLTTFRKDRRGAEGGLKYALFGATSAALMLYGMSLLYGLTGSLDLTDPVFSRQLTQADPLVRTVILGLTLSGLLFKISAVPFHFWNPDVYQAAPTPTVSLFSVAPKAAAFLVLLRILLLLSNNWSPVLVTLAFATIAVGNFAALAQRDAKRLLAYSSIAQSGFVLTGLAAGSELGVQSVGFYLATYLFASMGAFLLIDLLHPDASTDDYALTNYVGQGKRQPVLAVLLTVVLVSLVGLPPTVGFTAKLFVFSALWEAYQASGDASLAWLLGFGLLNTVVSLFYYLKLPLLLFFREPAETQMLPRRVTAAQLALAGVLAGAVVVLFLKADALVSWMNGL